MLKLWRRLDQLEKRTQGLEPPIEPSAHDQRIVDGLLQLLSMLTPEQLDIFLKDMADAQPGQGNPDESELTGAVIYAWVTWDGVSPLKLPPEVTGGNGSPRLPGKELLDMLLEALKKGQKSFETDRYGTRLCLVNPGLTAVVEGDYAYRCSFRFSRYFISRSRMASSTKSLTHRS